MPCRVFALSALLALMVVASPAAARPLSIPELVRLADNDVGETVLRALVEAEGLSTAIGADEVLTLKAAGLSDALIAWMVGQSRQGLAARPALDDDGVVYGERQGILVVRARGGGDDPREAPPPPPTPAAAPAPSPVVVVQAPPPAEAHRAEAPSVANPYPVGAVHGLSGSTVFLPARFGDPPSAFGRVITTPVHGAGYGPQPYWNGAGHERESLGLGYVGSVEVGPRGRAVPTRVQGARPGQGYTTVRTSRGPLRVPN